MNFVFLGGWRTEFAKSELNHGGCLVYDRYRHRRGRTLKAGSLHQDTRLVLRCLERAATIRATLDTIDCRGWTQVLYRDTVL